MTKEIYHEGWLTKSPPTKRIWRARWRRRWFTLKQGEIPEQFCLEYYTDRNCRKLKGVIDLDQCEQVDSGLQLEHRKQKFQHMFDVKTPRRTYYLAADSEEEMNYWVNCICQVCNLQDLSRQQPNYNVGAESTVNQPTATSSPITTAMRKNSSPNVEHRDLSSQTSHSLCDRSSVSVEQPNDNNNSLYQNFDIAFPNSTYNNRETLICDESLNSVVSASAQRELTENYYNFVAIANDANPLQEFERSNSMRTSTHNEANRNDTNGLPTPNHGRTQSLTERKSTSTLTRKIPEMLKLNDTFSNGAHPSPSLSASSGPYIAISECITGNPLIDRENPMTPLNSLNPKFYETPRSHINNIGLNLTNDQPYSPKRNNCPTGQPVRLSRSARSSPTDSESVFTDDEEWPHTITTETSGDRKLRPSDSSVENDAVVFTYAHRFSKLPYEENAVGETATVDAKHVHSRRSQQVAGLLLEEDDNDERNKEINSSDTENASPAITFGPKDHTSYVEENYDIPRSHHLPYLNVNSSSSSSGANGSDIALTPLVGEPSATTSFAGSTSTLNSSTLQRSRQHSYTNAAPTKVEGNVFRYDFDEQCDAPVVDRKLKPKINHQDEKEEKNATITPPTKPIRPISSISVASSVQTPGTNTPTTTDMMPPCIDRKLKPATPDKYGTYSLRRRDGPSNLSFAASTSDTEFHTDLNAEKFSQTLPRNYNNSSSSTTAAASVLTVSLAPISIASNACGRQIGKLDYFDLDHSNAPSICKNANTSASTSDLSSNAPNTMPTHQILSSNRHSGFGPTASTSFNSTATGTMKKATHIDPVAAAPSTAANSGIVYKQIDFFRTEAFMRTRQDAELNRARNRLKE